MLLYYIILYGKLENLKTYIEADLSPQLFMKQGHGDPQALLPILGYILVYKPLDQANMPPYSLHHPQRNCVVLVLDTDAGNLFGNAA